MRVWHKVLWIIGLSLIVILPCVPSAMADFAENRVGVEWINDFPGTVNDRSHWDESGNGFYNKLVSAGWTGKFRWTNWNAWEKDFKRAASGGWEQSYADNADAVMLCTHGSTAWDPLWGRTNHSVYFGSIHDDHHLVPGDAYRSYGNKELEWLCFDSCSTLADRGYWYTTFDGLHLMLGFANTMYVISYGDGRRWAEYMIDDGWWDWPKTVTQAWFSTVDDLQPQGVKARVLAEVYDNYNDYLWGQGYVSPDPSYNGWYWYWDHTAGSEPPLQTPAVGAMLLYDVVPKQVDENYVLEMARKFAIEGEIGQDKENFYVAQDGEVLTVDRFQGSFRYQNLNKLWVAPKEPPALPRPDQGTEIALSFLKEEELFPDDAVFYKTVIENQVKVLTEKNGEELIETEVQRIAINLQAEFARHLALDGEGKIMASVMGPGSKLKLYIGNEGEIIGAHGGWKDVQTAGMIPVLSQDKVLSLFEKYRDKITLEKVPAFDNFEIKSATLGYYERRIGEAQAKLIPAWIVEADFFLTAGNLSSSTSPQAALAGPYASGYIFLPAAEEFISPVATIQEPTDGSTFSAGDIVTFLAKAEYGATPYTFEWYSDEDGYLGAGQELKTDALSVVRRNESIVPHTITLMASDSRGNTASDSIQVTITPKSCESDFDLDGDVDGSDLAVFAADFGQTDCDTGEECEGNFDCDSDVVGSDLAVFAADFGRTDCPH